MSELAHALKVIGGLGLHVQKNPVGTYSFVGNVPTALLWECNDPELLDIAIKYGSGLARSRAKREGKVFQTRTWSTEADARAEACRLGFEVRA